MLLEIAQEQSTNEGDEAATQRIAEAAAMAPSADNNQPWRICRTPTGMEVFLEPERFLRSDVYEHMFDLTGIGAVTENARIAGLAQGLDVDITWCADALDCPSIPVAKLAFQGTDQIFEDASLFPYIAQRCTNRRLYSTKPISKSELGTLANCLEVHPGVQCDWITEAREKWSLARLVAAADSKRFELPSFHEELVEQLRFTEREAQRTRDGLDVSTLELPVFGKSFLRLFSQRQVAVWFRRLGITKLMALPASFAVQRSGAIAVFSVDTKTPESFLECGRAIQRFWLEATRLGLQAQPIGSLPVFLAQQDGQLSEFAKHLHERLLKLAPRLDSRCIQLILRIGKARAPSARSLRRPVSFHG